MIKRMVLKFHITLLFVTLFAGITSAQSTNTLWYKQAAEHFEESLVLGNGKMGATVYGGDQSEKIHLNDITLWYK